jgi:hypothetical protein
MALSSAHPISCPATGVPFCDGLHRLRQPHQPNWSLLPTLPYSPQLCPPYTSLPSQRRATSPSTPTLLHKYPPQSAAMINKGHLDQTRQNQCSIMQKGKPQPTLLSSPIAPPPPVFRKKPPLADTTDDDFFPPSPKPNDRTHHLCYTTNPPTKCFRMRPRPLCYPFQCRQQLSGNRL